MSPFDHIILFLFLFACFFAILREKQTYIDKHFWKAVMLPFIAYIIIIGVRYGWGVDYLRYEESYETKQIDLGYDIGFTSLQKLLHWVGLNKFWMASMVFATLFISSFFLLLKNIGGYSKYMIMLFLPATLLLNTYAIRQFVAISFVLFAFCFIISENKYKWYVRYSCAAILALIAYLIHGASLFFAIPLGLAFILRLFKPLKTSFSVLLYISSIVFSSVFIEYITAFFDKYAAILTVTDHLQGYVDGYINMVANDDVDMFGHGGIYLYFEYLSRIILIVLSGWALRQKPNKMVSLFYNIMLLGLCMQQIFFTSEIFRRLLDPIFMLYCIPVGYALYLLFENNKVQNVYYRKPTQIIMSVILLLYIYYPMYKFIFFCDIAGFIWDK